MGVNPAPHLLPRQEMHFEHFDRRMGFVETTLRDHFNLVPSAIDTVALDEWIPFAFNNYIFLITVPPAYPASTPRYPALTAMPIPEGTTKLIMRLPNPDPRTDLNNTNRVANEVAAMHLFRQAVQGSKYDHVVPQVYGWEEGDHKVCGEQGWILLEYKAGVNLTEEKPMETLKPEERSRVLEQMADLWGLIRSVPVPQDGFGGLKFNDKGEIVLGQLSLCPGGPYKTYAEYMRAEFSQKINEADRAAGIGGWRADGLRERIDKYLSQGLQAEIEGLKLKDERCYTHADFTIANAHFDPDTLDIVAMFDYDFGYVALAYDDYLMSLSTMNYTFPALFLDAPPKDPKQIELQQYILDGFPCDHGDDVDLDVAAKWHQLLIKRGIKMPKDLPRIKELAEIRWFLGNLTPHMLARTRFVTRNGPEKTAETHIGYTEKLGKWLAKRGY